MFEKSPSYSFNRLLKFSYNYLYFKHIFLRPEYLHLINTILLERLKKTSNDAKTF